MGCERCGGAGEVLDAAGRVPCPVCAVPVRVTVNVPHEVAVNLVEIGMTPADVLAAALARKP